MVAARSLVVQTGVAVLAAKAVGEGMSTEYRYFVEAIREVHPQPDGSVRVVDDTGRESVVQPRLLRLLADRDNAPITTRWGGTDTGCIVAENVRGLDPSLLLISDNCEVVAVANIRAVRGRGKWLPCAKCGTKTSPHEMVDGNCKACCAGNGGGSHGGSDG